MESFRCYDNSDVIATLMMTNFHLNTTVVAIFPNVCLWRSSLCSDLVLTLKNRIEPSSYARMAYVVAIWPSFLFDSFVKIWATCDIFFWQMVYRPPWQKISRMPMSTCMVWVSLTNPQASNNIFSCIVWLSVRWEDCLLCIVCRLSFVQILTLDSCIALLRSWLSTRHIYRYRN